MHKSYFLKMKITNSRAFILMLVVSVLKVNVLIEANEPPSKAVSFLNGKHLIYSGTPVSK